MSTEGKTVASPDAFDAMERSGAASARSLRSLDLLNFFVADVRTGVGPFVALYLTENHWNALQIGVALTAAELAGVLTQAPGGAVMDRLRSKRLLMVVAVAVLSLCALGIAHFPQPAVVDAAQTLLGMTGSIFVPGINAITMGLVGYAMLGTRTGRNTAFGSAGNVVAAVSMALIGYFYSTRAIFYFVALLSVPTILSVLGIKGREIDYEWARGGSATSGRRDGSLRQLLRDRRILVFAVITILFHLGNGAMLASMGEVVSKTELKHSDLWMGGFVTIPQVVMALTGALVGRIADQKGRKGILLVGLAFLPLRAILAAASQKAAWLVALQLLDGVSAGIFGVVSVLVIADCTEGTGHYNLALGAMGAEIGIGASISTVLAGFVVQEVGFRAAFLALSFFGAASWVCLWLFMPETMLKKEVRLSSAENRIAVG